MFPTRIRSAYRRKFTLSRGYRKLPSTEMLRSGRHPLAEKVIKFESCQRWSNGVISRRGPRKEKDDGAETNIIDVFDGMRHHNYREMSPVSRCRHVE